jgi:adenylyltransferase/sulfurtransferase
MEAANASAQALRNQILATETELQKLKQELAQVEASAAFPGLQDLSVSDGPGTQQNGNQWPLSEEEYKRYGRQMILPGIGIQGL